MKALLLRVGIDTNYGASSPIFNDNSYQFLPIYYRNRKEIEKNEKRTYKDLIGFRGETLAKYLPEKLQDKIVHLDPEFETFTYGDPTRIKRKALLKLNKDDLLVFYLGGVIDKNGSKELGCFIFAYFVVEKVYNWNELRITEKKKASVILKNNAHIISSKSKHNLVIVKGTSNSKLLDKCIKITDRNKTKNNPPYYTSEYYQKHLGIRKYIVYSIPIWIEDAGYIRNLKKVLKIETK